MSKLEWLCLLQVVLWSVFSGWLLHDALGCQLDSDCGIGESCAHYYPAQPGTCVPSSSTNSTEY